MYILFSAYACRQHTTTGVNLENRSHGIYLRIKVRPDTHNTQTLVVLNISNRFALARGYYT